MYGAGWMLVVRPAGNDWQAGLVTGQAVEPAYAAWRNEQDFPGCPGDPGCTGEGE